MSLYWNDTSNSYRRIPETGDQMTIYIIISIVIFILFFITAYIIYSTRYSKNKKIVHSGNKRNSKFKKCPQGQCATNILTGEKRCPSFSLSNSSSSVSFNEEMEVCNSPYSCENPTTPYAVKSDGSTVLNTCEPGVVCRCVNKPQCPDYVVSIFNTKNGNAFQGLPGTNTSFTQSSTYINNDINVETTPPIQYDNPRNQFCSIPPEWVFGITTIPPNVPSGDIPSDNIPPNNILDAGRIWPTKCIQGALAYVPDDPTVIDFSKTRMSCVIGDPEICNGNEYSYWDNRINTMCCINKDTKETTCPTSIPIPTFVPISFD